jgi:putative oxidoreductase
MLTSPRAQTPRPADIALLAGRTLLALIFIHEGATLALNFGNTVRVMATQGIGLPLVLAVIALQLGAGFALALGWFTRLGAISLGLFCLATAALFHTNFAVQNELLHFEKDLAIAGGMFVLATAGAGRLSLDARLGASWRRRCLSSPSAAMNSGGEARVQIANALTASLLHAEAVRQHSAGMGLRAADLSSSCQHIAMNAERVRPSLAKPTGEVAAP